MSCDVLRNTYIFGMDLAHMTETSPNSGRRGGNKVKEKTQKEIVFLTK